LGATLLTAWPAAAVVTIDIGDAAGRRGGTATVVVTLGGIAEGGVAANNAQLDVLYSTAVFEDPDPATACTLAERLRILTSTITLPEVPVPPAGLKRLRLSVVDTISPPRGAVTDGAFYTCVLRIRAQAPVGQTVLQATRPNVGDTAGRVLESRGDDGMVRIGATCAGDQDGDGVVSAAEATRAVLAFGRRDVSLNPAADTDLNGAVSAAEATRAVLNFGRRECNP
jgi:hypothetical protein